MKINGHMIESPEKMDMQSWKERISDSVVEGSDNFITNIAMLLNEFSDGMRFVCEQKTNESDWKNPSLLLAAAGITDGSTAFVSSDANTIIVLNLQTVATRLQHDFESIVPFTSHGTVKDILTLSEFYYLLGVEETAHSRLLQTGNVQEDASSEFETLLEEDSSDWEYDALKIKLQAARGKIQRTGLQHLLDRYNAATDHRKKMGKST